jgi:hypothetical protein
MKPPGCLWLEGTMFRGYFGKARLRPGIGDVGADSVIEQQGVLQDHTDIPSQRALL